MLLCPIRCQTIAERALSSHESPALRGVERMRSQLTITTVALTAAVTLVACTSGSGGTHTQSLSPVPTTATSTTSSSVSATSTSASGLPTSSISSPRTVPSRPTPTVAPAAQKAVDAYIAASNVLLGWDRDPGRAKAPQLSSYVTSTVLAQVMNAYQSMARSGLAYRGTPDQSHIKVIAAGGTSAAFTDCPTPSANDPYTQYVVATGEAVKSTAPSGLHPKAVTVIYQTGRWRISGIVPDLAKACTP